MSAVQVSCSNLSPLPNHEELDGQFKYQLTFRPLILNPIIMTMRWKSGAKTGGQITLFTLLQMPIFFSEKKKEDLKWRISKWSKGDSQILTRCPCWLVWFLKSLPHGSIGDHRPEEECDPLELELQVFVGRPARVLELVVWESSRSSLHCPTMLLSALWFYSLRHKCL